MPEHLKEFDRQSVKMLRPQLEEALAGFGEAYGVAVNVGKARYTTQNVVFSIEFAVTDDGGQAQTQEVRDFRERAPLHGLSADDLNRTFIRGLETYSIVGWNRKAIRYPIIAAHNRTGKVYKFTVEVVKVALG